ncbi:MAG: hypothetical protein KZQ96_19830 [Candidatus Thiodiazotropha sp. (ex Lucinoma borealis)]|nr:hypothetical protein [Candidatus Thiodiazotropha sp. (ex Lucinoma borealis)]
MFACWQYIPMVRHLQGLETMRTAGVTNQNVKRIGTCPEKRETPRSLGYLMQCISAMLVLVAVLDPLWAAQNDVTQFVWENKFGAGGAQVPTPGEYPDPAVSPLSLTNVVAVVFPPDTHDILFVGEYEEGKPGLLSPEGLSDALVVAYRVISQGNMPAVSIDYTEAQEECFYRKDLMAKQGHDVSDMRCINENDDLNVRYEGGIGGTELGQVAFEADRIMKSLALGKDNVSKQPVRSNVKDYKNRLQLIQIYNEAGAVRNGEVRDWDSHRFWIEPKKGQVERSRDGRTLFIDATFWVDVRKQVATRAGMEDANDREKKSARAFAAHMTKHYREFGNEFPVYNKLHAFAQMTYAAQALLARSGNDGRDDSFNQVVDHDWMQSDYQVETVETSPKTKAIIVPDDPEKIGFSLTGGVNLAPTLPRNNPGIKSNRAAVFQKVALAAYARNPEAPGLVKVAGRQYLVTVSRRGRANKLESWQTDLSRGLIQISRDYGNRPADAPSVLGDWNLRIPEIAKIGEAVRFENEGMAPAYVRIRDRAGRMVTLDQLASLTWLGKEPVRGYLSRDGSKSLYLYSDVWLYVNGEIQFQSINDGPYRPVFDEHDYMVEFSPEGKHAAQWMKSGDGIVHYEYKGDRLVVIEDNHGGRARLKYSSTGMLARLEYGEGEFLGYRYDNLGRLAAVIDKHGYSIEYEHDDAGGELRGIRTYVVAASSPIESVPTFRMENPPDRGEEQQAKAALQDRGINVLTIGFDPAGDDMIVINEAKASYIDLLRAKAALLSGEGGMSKQGVRKRLFSRVIFDENLIVTTGPPDLRNGMAELLRQLPDVKSVATASNLERANSLLDKRRENKTPARARVLFMDSPAFDRQTAESLYEYARAADTGDTVIVAGHNDAGFEKYVASAAESGELNNKTVIFVSCGSSNTPGLVETAFVHGAQLVVYFKAPIRTRDAAPAIEYIQRGLSAGRTVQEIFDDIKNSNDLDGQLKYLFDHMEIQIGTLLPVMHGLAGNTVYLYEGNVPEWG